MAHLGSLWTARGYAYVAGSTYSDDFPITPGALRSACANSSNNCLNYSGDAFVTKLNPTGSRLVYSTYLGGSNCGRLHQGSR